MYDSFKRRINYLRVSVTDRCNLRCTYCMPAEGVKMLSHADILTYEEIFEVIQMAVSMGIDKVRITGGEPLVRKGIVEFIGRVAGIRGIKDLGLTTNGILLEEFALALAGADLELPGMQRTFDQRALQPAIRQQGEGMRADIVDAIQTAAGDMEDRQVEPHDLDW